MIQMIVAQFRFVGTLALVTLLSHFAFSQGQAPDAQPINPQRPITTPDETTKSGAAKTLNSVADDSNPELTPKATTRTYAPALGRPLLSRSAQAWALYLSNQVPGNTETAFANQSSLTYLPMFSTQAVPYSSGQQILQRKASPQPYYNNLFDRQRGVPRAGNLFLERPGVTFLVPLTVTLPRGPLDPSVLSNDNPGALAAISAIDVIGISPHASIRFDTAFDSTKLAATPNSLPTGFYPSTIPVRGDANYGLGERATVLTPAIATQFGIALSVDTSIFGPATFVTDLAATTTTESQPQQGLSFLHFFGRLGNLYIGKTDSAFSDVEAIPATINPAGPNAFVYVQHAALGYVFAVYEDSQSLLAASLAVEAPENSTTAFDFANTKSFSNRSRIPDFAGHIRLVNKCWGHVQFATVLRDIGIENVSYKTSSTPAVTIPQDDANAFGWGTMFSGSIHPFQDAPQPTSDYFSFIVLYGRGVGNYVLDLRAIGGYDGFLNENGDLIALPVLTYSAGYTHYWSPKWRSTLAYSQVDVDSFAQSAGSPSPYNHGRYASVNLLYLWDFNVTSLVQPRTGVGQGFAGIEYMYGERENLNSLVGTNHRAEFTVGYKY